MQKLDNFTRGYLECALWADGGDAPLESVPENVLHQSITDCADFQITHFSLLSDYMEHFPLEYAGHDFYLTRCGHGAGFWDRGLGKLGDKLTEAARVYGSVDDFTMMALEAENV